MTVGQREKSGSVAATSLPATPPLHIHVDSSTAVLLHIRKPKGKNDKEEGPSGAAPPGKTSKSLGQASQKKKCNLPATIPYIPDPLLGKEVNDMIEQHIKQCTQASSNPCPYHRRPQHLTAGSDAVGHEGKFLRRSLDVLKRDRGQTSKEERPTAGEDKPSEQLAVIRKQIEEINAQLIELEQSYRTGKEVLTPAKRELIVRKRETLCEKLRNLQCMQRAIQFEIETMGDGPSGGSSGQLDAVQRKNEELTCELKERESQIDALKRQMACEKDYVQSLCRMQAELEETRCGLQKELQSKNAEIERATIQTRNFQNQMAEHLAEVERLQAYVEQTTKRAECEKEALKKALRVQTEKARCCEEGLNKANIRLECMEQESERMRQTVHIMEAELERLRPEVAAKQELERVCEKLQAHLKELQPLPEKLRQTEQKLREEQQRNHNNEQRICEQARLISELTGKIDQCFEDVKLAQERLETACCENDALVKKMEAIMCQHQQTQDTIAELNSSLQLKTELINQLNLKLEDKDVHSMGMTRQLEEALAESNRLTRLVEEKACQLELQHHGRVRDLEAQLMCSRQECRQLRQEKAELECRYGKQMQDLKEKLEQCDAATHNMQSYISYLKNSYAAVFNDPNLTAMCNAPSPSSQNVC